ncbi:MAG: glucosyltransferase domain-containing protein [Eubacteriales bacterium]|nr:glucosyltransferase domain-containing protein [Eubacteriales bacterium]
MKNESCMEKLMQRLSDAAAELRIPALSAVLSGLAAYMFCFVNKLEIMDDLSCMFGQGASLSSGRWGLDIAQYFMPTFSVPWLNGIISLLLITATICIVVKMFRIRNPLLRLLLPALLMTFPTQTCTFGYMFTAPQYALALLMAIGAADLFASSAEGKCLDTKKTAAGGILLILSLSFYQSYVAVTASYLVVYVITVTLKGERSAKDTLRCGLILAAEIIGSMLLYYGLTAVIQKLWKAEMNGYAEGNLNGFADVLFGIRVAYTSFIGYFYKGYYDLASNPASKAAHILVAVLIVSAAFLHIANGKKKEEKGKRTLLLALCLFLLPPAVNSIRIISSLFHNLMLFSFTSVYILAASVLEICGETIQKKLAFLWKDAVYVCMIITVACNIYFSNCIYYKMYLQLNQAESFYTSVISALMQDEKFTVDSPVAFIGSSDVLYDIPMIYTGNLAGIRDGIVGTYSQEEFIKTFLGVKMNVCDWDVTDILETDSRVIEMPSYPSYGSIRNIDGIYVVRLGNIGE